MVRIYIIISLSLLSSYLQGQNYDVFDFDITAFETCTVTNEKRVNTDRHEFAPVLFGGGIAYVTEIEEESDKKRGPYFDLKFTHLEKEIDIPFSEKIHSNHHLGPLTFTSDQRTVYYTKNETSKKGKDGKFHMKMYKSVYMRREWKERSSFRYNSDDYSVLHPTVSPNGKILIFASNMPGGYGGYDLYMCKAVGRGWKKPINLGPNINTEKNEVFPFIYENHWIIFASDGREGYGGLDLYIADNFEDEWSYGENLGNTLNSTGDDFSMTIDPTSSYGYFASSREGGKGKDDIYKIEFVKPIIVRKDDDKESQVDTKLSEGLTYFDLTLKVQDKQSRQPIEEANILFQYKEESTGYQSTSIQTVDNLTLIQPGSDNHDKKSNKSNLKTDLNGQIKVKLSSGKYHIKLRKEGYADAELELDTQNMISELILSLNRKK